MGGRERSRDRKALGHPLSLSLLVLLPPLNIPFFPFWTTCFPSQQANLHREKANDDHSTLSRKRLTQGLAQVQKRRNHRIQPLG